MRLFKSLFKGNSRPDPELQPEGGLNLARRQAFERMRARNRQAPPFEDAPPAPKPLRSEPGRQPVPAAQQAAPPAAPVTPDGPPPGDSADQALAGLAGLEQGSGDGGGANPLAGGEAIDSNLMDIFMDAKTDSDETSLASEVEDVPITDLLSDLAGVSKGLGIDPAKPRQAAPTATEEAVPVPPEAVLAEIAADALIIDDPDEALVAPAIEVKRVQIPEEEPEPEPEVEEPPPVTAIRRFPRPMAQEEPEPQEPQRTVSGADSASGPRRYVLHVLAFGLSLSMAAGFGVHTAHGGALLLSESGPTPAVLAYLRQPALPDTITTVVRETAAPSPSPSPAATPTPEPTATPAPLGDIGGSASADAIWVQSPPFYMYTVEEGDSFTSIADSIGACPDHVFWANPSIHEEDPLYVGERLLLPSQEGLIYIARRGDTLDKIAGRYGVMAQDIADFPANRVSLQSTLSEGEGLLIPGGIPPSATTQDSYSREMTRSPSSDGMVWPFYGPITTYFGEQRPGYTHNAIDIGGLGHYGAPVGASKAGEVSLTVWADPNYGNYVIVSHGDGSQTLYAHLRKITVREGQQVDRSEQLGTLGCTGVSTGTHLHFELRINGRPVDPLAYLP